MNNKRFSGRRGFRAGDLRKSSQPRRVSMTSAAGDDIMIAGCVEGIGNFRNVIRLSENVGAPTLINAKLCIETKDEELIPLLDIFHDSEKPINQDILLKISTNLYLVDIKNLSYEKDNDFNCSLNQAIRSLSVFVTKTILDERCSFDKRLCNPYITLKHRFMRSPEIIGDSRLLNLLLIKDELQNAIVDLPNLHRIITENHNTPINIQLDRKDVYTFQVNLGIFTVKGFQAVLTTRVPGDDDLIIKSERSAYKLETQEDVPCAEEIFVETDNPLRAKINSLSL